MAAGVLVGVVADDASLRDGRVDAPVDAREPCRDLVHGAVQVVDPPLERDGEVDEVGLAAAEQHELRGPDAPQLRRCEHRATTAATATTAARDRDPACGRAVNAHRRAEREDDRYSAELFDDVLLARHRADVDLDRASGRRTAAGRGS